MSTFEELKQEILNRGGSEYQAEQYLKSVEPEKINSAQAFINSKIDEIKFIEEPQIKPKKELTIEQRLAKKQKELAKAQEKVNQIQLEIDELTLKKIEDFKTHLSEEDCKLFMEFKASQQAK